MLSVVTFKWRKDVPNYRSDFQSEHVNVLRDMVARHYPDPHRFLCVTDDARGLDVGIEAIPLWKDYAKVQNPAGAHQPSCYRRLKCFSPEIESIFGKRFVVIDLDTVIVGDLRPLWNRSEDFVIWGETDKRNWYNGSMWMMTAGARKHVLERFNPQASPREAKRAGRFGSDQGWICHVLGPGEAMWGRKDGVYSYRVHIAPHGNRLPDNARVVMFHGKIDPWGYQAQQIPWIRQHWRRDKKAA